MPLPKEMIAHAFQQKVLDPTKHLMLVEDLDKFANRANVAASWLVTSAIGKFNEQETKYLTQINKLANEHHIYGMVMIGNSGEIINQMSLMIGVLVRSMIDARMLTVGQVMDDMKSGDYPDATVLFIPNFYSPAEVGKFDYAKIAALGDLLTHRSANRMQTVIGMSEMDGLKDHYGSRVLDLIAENYLGLGAYA